MPPGFHLLIAAQFLSALADNALLLIAMALLQQQGQPAWWAPLLKFCFTIAYVALAPLVGPLADAMPKARLMMAMNAVKVLGLLALLQGLNPLWAMAVIGMGAAAYAPAKYGLVTELVPAQKLVVANGWIEVTTVCALLLGTALGGALISPAAAALLSRWWPAWAHLDLATTALLLAYAAAAVLNMGIPDSGVRYAPVAASPRLLCRQFVCAQRALWRDAEGRLSMSVTTLFWGVAAMMQFAVLRWAVDDLGLLLSQAAYLQAVVAVGIVFGAALAGRFLTLSQAWRVLPLGVGMGLLVPAAALVHHWLQAAPLLALVGLLGGAMVVPLNALLQQRGHHLLSAGQSIAVQNFNENLSMLVMLGAYAALSASGATARNIMVGLGLLVALLVGGLHLQQLRQRRRARRRATWWGQAR